MHMPLLAEPAWVWTGVLAYAVCAATCWMERIMSRFTWPVVGATLWIAVGSLGIAVMARWQRTGQGPFLTLYEVLLSNAFSLGLVYALAAWRWPAVRVGARVAVPALLLLALWAVRTSAEAVPLPPTYDNPWLWAHVIAGKLFLGATLVATGLAGALLLGASPCSEARMGAGTTAAGIDTLVWRSLSLAFVAESAMLVAGAAWAQDAWGRFWSWDPLETSAFLTWLLLGTLLHLRLAWRLAPVLGWALTVTVFGLALTTFLGVPFMSGAPHRGFL